MDSNLLQQIKLRHLSAFVETVRSGSLKAAAARLHLTQSAISKIIRDLEAILSVTLLTRDRGGIALTPKGAAFRQFAEQSLASAAHGLSRIRAIGTGHAAPLRIGALPSVAADVLPDAVQQFASLSPDTPLTVEDGSVGALLDRLRHGALDLVVGRMGAPDRMTGLSFTQLYSEQVIFAAAQGHALRQVRDLRALSTARILYPPPDAAIRPSVDRFLLSLGVTQWPNRIETVSGAFGRAMTLGPSQAIWIISHGVVAQDIAAGRMVALPIDTRPMAGPVGIMARSEEDPQPAARMFRQCLLQASAQRDHTTLP